MSNGAASPGIKPRMYKSGSIIYFEGDKSEYIYILKSGRVMLTSVRVDTGAEVKEDVRTGEFFGVKSALGRYPREETAQTIGETVVLVMPVADFERLVLRNVNVVKKMLRVFSNQLRRIGRMVRSVLGDEEVVNPEVELFRIGEYYYGVESFNHALYAYKKFMEHYPDSPNASVAMDRIKAIQSGSAMAEDVGMSPSFSEPSAPSPAMDSGLDDMSDFSLDDEPEEHGIDDGFSFSDDTPAVQTELTSEMDDFLQDDSLDDMGDFDDFDLDGDSESILQKLEEAKRLLEMELFERALPICQDIIAMSPSNPNEEEGYAEALLGAGRCLHEAGSSKEGLQTLGRVIKEYPKTPSLKPALFEAGRILEEAGQSDKAIAYYNKVMNMTPKDSMNKEALSRISALQRG